MIRVVGVGSFKNFSGIVGAPVLEQVNIVGGVDVAVRPIDGGGAFIPLFDQARCLRAWGALKISLCYYAPRAEETSGWEKTACS